MITSKNIKHYHVEITVQCSYHVKLNLYGKDEKKTDIHQLLILDIILSLNQKPIFSNKSFRQVDLEPNQR